jgi:hypothetical protein
VRTQEDARRWCFILFDPITVEMRQVKTTLQNAFALLLHNVFASFLPYLPVETYVNVAGLLLFLHKPQSWIMHV